MLYQGNMQLDHILVHHFENKKWDPPTLDEKPRSKSNFDMSNNQRTPTDPSSKMTLFHINHIDYPHNMPSIDRNLFLSFHTHKFSMLKIMQFNRCKENIPKTKPSIDRLSYIPELPPDMRRKYDCNLEMIFYIKQIYDQV